MKITINTDVLKKYNLSLNSFLILLLGYYDVDVGLIREHLKEKGLADPDLFKKGNIILSDNTKNLIAKILVESDEKIANSEIDFTDLAKKLQEIYPSGKKPGTTYDWRSDTDVVAQKLRILIVKYNFTFTEKEAIEATEEYVKSFEDKSHMHLLRNFILCTSRNKDGSFNMNSDFMSIIENIRDNNENNN